MRIKCKREVRRFLPHEFLFPHPLYIEKDREIEYLLTQRKALTPIMQAILTTCFTWFLTDMGAAFVFFFKTIKREVLNAMLLAPSIAMAVSTVPLWREGFLD